MVDFVHIYYLWCVFFFQFQVMRPKAEKETEDLYQSTRILLENFSKLKASQYVTSGGAQSSAQSALYSIVREGREWMGKIVS